MGKITDALERRKKEKAIKAAMLPIGRPQDKDRERAKLPSSRDLIDRNNANPKLVVSSAPGSIDAENFKFLRAQILFPKNGERRRIIMVTSVFPGEGKTFVAANLAASIALGINEHVLLVDCDFRRPNLHDMLGYSNSEGLHEFLTRKKKLDELIILTKIDKLSILTAGSSSQNPSELLASMEMKDFLIEVRERYNDRFIVIDTAPIHVTSEASVVSNYVDGIISGKR